MKTTEFHGKRVLVTGGVTGIGDGISRAFLRAGAEVFISHAPDEDPTPFESAVAAAGGRGGAFESDFRLDGSVQNLFNRIESGGGAVDVLVNNAGLTEPLSFWEMTVSQFLETLQVNLIGAFLCAQRAANSMRHHGIQGRIINISSVNARITRPGHVHYSASKGGLEAMTRAIALETAPHGITVNAIAPGAIEVERHRTPDYDREEAGKLFPVGRIGQPSDVASMAMHLASEETDYLTGETITIDGGLTVCLP